MSFGHLGGRGVFTKEIEQALLDGEIDIAVHSLKDLSTRMPDGLELAAVPVRESPFDGWFCPAGLTLEQLPPGARVATGSLRREAQVRALRPDIEIVPIRGNVQTRIDKVRRGEADATLLAVAGMRRLGLEHELHGVFAPEQLTPAMGQGALGVQTRTGELKACMARLNDAASRTAVEIERAFLRRIGGGFRTPAGVFVRPHMAGWRLTALLATPDARHLDRRVVDAADPEHLMNEALRLAETMVADAPPDLLETLNGPRDDDHHTVG